MPPDSPTRPATWRSVNSLPGPLHTLSPTGRTCPDAESCPWKVIFCDGDRRHADRNETNLSGILFASYQMPIQPTRAESIACFVVRSEWMFHGDDRHRLSLRRHLYERFDTPSDPARGVCDPFEGYLGDYVGFVDLRTMYTNASMALGILAPPRHLAEDPDCRMITGNYGPLFGGPAFPSTVYSMQDDETAGAVCAQSAMIAVLGMMTDRGALLEGSYSLTMRGFEGEAARFAPGEWVADPGADPASGIGHHFPTSTGLTLDQMSEVMKGLGVGTSVVSLGPKMFRLPTEAGRNSAIHKLALRSIECHLNARCPVILSVDSAEWAGRDSSENGRGEGHAVTVIGLRSRRVADGGDQFIVHDPAQKPFVVAPTTSTFEACQALFPDALIEMLFAVEASVKRSLWNCITHLRVEAGVAIDAYFAPIEGGKDYRFSSVAGPDIPGFLHPKLRTQAGLGELRNRLPRLEADRYWVLAFYSDLRLVNVWLYAANGADGSDWELRLFCYALSGRWQLRGRGNDRTARDLF